MVNPPHLGASPGHTPKSRAQGPEPGCAPPGCAPHPGKKPRGHVPTASHAGCPLNPSLHPHPGHPTSAESKGVTPQLSDHFRSSRYPVLALPLRPLLPGPPFQIYPLNPASTLPPTSIQSTAPKALLPQQRHLGLPTAGRVQTSAGQSAKITPKHTYKNTPGHTDTHTDTQKTHACTCIRAQAHLYSRSQQHSPAIFSGCLCTEPSPLPHKPTPPNTVQSPTRPTEATCLQDTHAF